MPIGNWKLAIGNIDMRGNRIQLGLSLLTALFLLATLFVVLLFALSPATPAARGPLLPTAFVAILIGSLVFIRADERMLRQGILNLLRNTAEAVAGTKRSGE